MILGQRQEVLPVFRGETEDRTTTVLGVPNLTTTSSRASTQFIGLLLDLRQF